MADAVELGAVAARVRFLEITCARCDKAWELDLAAELAEFGPTTPIWQVWDGLNRDCPNVDDAGIYNRCQLRALMLPKMKLWKKD